MIHFDFLHLFIIINSEMILRKFIAKERPCSKEREREREGESIDQSETLEYLRSIE